MNYISTYKSILGNIIITADDIGLTGLWFEKQKYFPENISDYKEKETEILLSTKKWLDIYFSCKKPDYIPPLNLNGTEFRKKVWKILLEIPYGKTTTYGEIAKKLAKDTGKKTMSSQAIGGAIAHNPISIIIPCHRVIGSDGSLTGYAGGIDRKRKLLELENR